MTDAPARIVAVAGCQRSGTTLIGQIIGAHPGAFLIDEPDGLYDWSDAWLARSDGSSPLFERAIASAAAKYCDHRKDWRRAANVGDGLVVLKAPNLTYRYAELAALRPDCRVVYPVRDVRAVVASMQALRSVPMVENQVRRLQHSPEMTARFHAELRRLTDPRVPRHVKCALVWRIKTGLYEQFRETGLETLVVKYEELVAEPASTGRRVCEHCALKWHESMLSHEGVLRGVGPGGTRRSRGIDTRSSARWRRMLSPGESRDVLEIGAELMTRLGYSDLDA